MAVINGLLAVFILFSFLAPVFMQIGWKGAGQLTYWFYGKFCHQLAFRSFFMFGPQDYYPLYTIPQNTEWLTYQQMFALPAEDFFAARQTLGNQTAGYKLALCQRDIAMYLALLLSGLIFAAGGKQRFKRLPLWVWLAVGVLPLAVDGITQLAGTGFNLFGLLTPRESTPLLRVITGALFGGFSGWYIYALIDQLAQDRTNEKSGIN